MYRHIKPPPMGERISMRADGSLDVPDRPIVPFIEGDGTGRDIVPVMREVVNAAVRRSYGGARAIEWMEVYAGEKAVALYGPEEALPAETIDAIRAHRVAIKGPLSAGVGGGSRSLSAALRMRLDCYAQVRPIRYFPGAPSPLKNPAGIDVVLFRETSEDIYTGIEWGAGTAQARRLVQVLTEDFGVKDIRFPDSASIGIKPISREGSTRLMRRALQYALRFGRGSVTMVHKGTVMKLTEGWFAKWGYQLAREEFGATETGDGSTLRIGTAHGEVLVKDTITDTFMQQSLLQPQDLDVIVTMSQNGDFISSALAAQVGGVGIAPGANMGDSVAFFEPNHGTAPRHAGKDMVNPSAVILSAQMMLAHLGWSEAADVVGAAVAKTIAAGIVTYDFARFIPGARAVSSSAFGCAVVEAMQNS
ncbi:MAG: NADP-dependent isocitrate dehydrogenase [Betaproteobacteria bacterium]|nr:NADP-dependent isocitrate dehydrogenase [Betaproteobacteria bacterium]